MGHPAGNGEGEAFCERGFSRDDSAIRMSREVDERERRQCTDESVQQTDRMDRPIHLAANEFEPLQADGLGPAARLDRKRLHDSRCGLRRWKNRG